MIAENRCLNRNWLCIALAITAWTITSFWYYFMLILAWGFAPVAMIYWSIPAAPLTKLSHKWFTRAGIVINPKAKKIIMICWSMLIIIMIPLMIIPDNSIWDHDVAEFAIGLIWPLYYAFPISLTIWMLINIIRSIGRTSGLSRHGTTPGF